MCAERTAAALSASDDDYDEVSEDSFITEETCDQCQGTSAGPCGLMDVYL